jgi:hypothetical protein
MPWPLAIVAMAAILAGVYYYLKLVARLFKRIKTTLHECGCSWGKGEKACQRGAPITALPQQGLHPSYCAGEIGAVLSMIVRDVEGVAIHNGPESCVGRGNADRRSVGR